MGTARGFGEAVAPNAPSPSTAAWRRPGLLEGPVRRGAAITCAGIAAGFWLSTALIGPVTPRQVAAAYLEARFDQDWPDVWALTCDSTRASTDFETFAEEAAHVHEYYFLPSDVDISIGDVELAGNGPSGYVKVSAKATSDQALREVAFDGDLALALEDGDFRVCGPG